MEIKDTNLSFEVYNHFKTMILANEFELAEKIMREHSVNTQKMIVQQLAEEQNSD